MKGCYIPPRLEIDDLTTDDAISTSASPYSEDLYQPWVEDIGDWNIITR